MTALYPIPRTNEARYNDDRLYIELPPGVATNIGFGATELSRAKITTMAGQTNSCLIFVIDNRNRQGKRPNIDYIRLLLHHY